MGGLKGLCKFKGKSAGRNSSGRITIFHRGGGAKRLQRRIDLKRSTASMGVVERVEYDPNRSARIALVRWMGDMQVPPPRKCEKMGKPAPLRKTVDPSTTNVRGIFSFCAMPGTRIVDHHQWRKTHPKDVFFSSFSVPKAGGVSLPLPLPRVAIAGANPAFLAMRVARQFAGKDTSSLREVQKYTPKDNIVWAHRIKPKAALSWQSSRQQETLGLVMPQKTATAKKTVFHKVGGK